MHADSSPITELVTDARFLFDGNEANVARVGGLTLPREREYIFRYTKPGYQTKSITFNLKLGRREYRRQLPDVRLKKNPAKSRTLGEATVTASKIRMVVKGDTLVYNADAFQLSQGSMLDGLIKMLPGFEITNGQIRVNGEFVSSLLVNGENFFDGNPQVALENLPGYMVDQIKVYRKEPEYNYITKDVRRDEFPLVVDVNLKRQYAIGWIANAEAGYGLDNHYLARLFGLRFTDHSRLSVFASADNVNDASKPGASAEMQAKSTTSGRSEAQKAGIDALIKDKKGIWKYSGNALFARREAENEQMQSTEAFHPQTGSTYSRTRALSLPREAEVSTTHKFDYRKRNGYLSLAGNGTYRHRNSRAEVLGASFRSDPLDAYRGASLDSIFYGSSDRLTALLLNRYSDRRQSRGDDWQGGISLTSYFTIPHTPDFVNLNANLQFSNTEGAEHSDYALRYGTPSAATNRDDWRRRYAVPRTWSLKADARVAYTYRPGWGSVTPYYQLNAAHNDDDYILYRLDALGNDVPDFGLLPSTTAALMHCLDARNTYFARQSNRTNAIGVNMYIYLFGGRQNIQLKPEWRWKKESLEYDRSALHTRSKRTLQEFIPEVSYGFDNFRLTYKLYFTNPELLSMQDYLDDSDPLNLYRGNPDLKRSRTHRVAIRRSYYLPPHDLSMQFNGYWQMTRHTIANASDYDTSTGVRTYQPRNVDGNWAIGGQASISRALDEKKQHLFSNTLNLDYQNSVDYVTERSSVRNLTLQETAKVNMRFKNFLTELSFGAKFLHAQTPRENFTTINSFDLRYGFSFQFSLPKDFSFNTNMTVLHRTGYSDASLNDCQFVANAQLSKNLVGGRVGLSLDAFDIFRSLSNIQKVLNAQGLTETWHNSLPSYVMLRIIYRFSKQPKK